MKSEFDRQLDELLDTNRIKRNESMKKHTTFQIGGPADYFVTPMSKEEIQAVLTLCKKERVPFYIIGNGSNLLVGDKGYPGVIIQIGSGLSQISLEDNGRVRSGSGVLLSKLAQEIAGYELTGFEFASGIPGSLGGAVCMNAGAYGGEMKDVISEVTVIDDKNEVRVLSNEQLNFSYRKSLVQTEGYIVVEVVLALQPGNKAEILKKMEELNGRRKEKQPLEFPSAGSTFKRPEGYFAGKLIDDAGLRGFRVGGAAVSEKHCGFVVNLGDATAADVRELIRQIDQRVFAQFGVHMEPEIRMLGEF